MVAEFIVCYEASNYGIWLRNFVTRLRIVDGIERPLKLYYDNNLQSCIPTTIGARRSLSTYTSSSLLWRKEFKVDKYLLSISVQTPWLQILSLRDCRPRFFMSTPLIWISYLLRIFSFSKSLCLYLYFRHRYDTFYDVFYYNYGL